MYAKNIWKDITEEKKGSVVGDINSIISVHYDTLRWIERTASSLNDKLDHLEGLH